MGRKVNDLRKKLIIEMLEDIFEKDRKKEYALKQLARYYRRSDVTTLGHVVEYHAPHLLPAYKEWRGRQTKQYSKTRFYLLSSEKRDKLSEKLTELGVRYD